MQRRGKTAAGTQRWFCPFCSKSSIRTNLGIASHHKQKLFIQWICGNATLREIAKVHKISVKTLQRWFKPFGVRYHYHISLKPLIMDAVSIESRKLMASIGRTQSNHTNFGFYIPSTFSESSYILYE